VFERQDGVRRFHLSKKAASWGPHWESLAKLASQVTDLLDAADEEMRQARQSLATDSVSVPPVRKRITGLQATPHCKAG
jgi:hypothetical protein